MLAKEGVKVYLLEDTKEALKYSNRISKFNKTKNVKFKKETYLRYHINFNF